MGESWLPLRVPVAASSAVPPRPHFRDANLKEAAITSTFPPGSPEHAAEEVWAKSLETAAVRAADYLTSVLPGLSARAGADRAPTPTTLTFDLPGAGSGTVSLDDPYRASLELNDLPREVWAAIHGLVFPDSYYFSARDETGFHPHDIRHSLPGRYTGECEERDAEDVLEVHADGRADLALYRLGVDLAARVLVVVRDAAGASGDRACTRCSLPLWRHRQPGGSGTCRSFTSLPVPETSCDMAAEALAPLLDEFNGWDLRGLVASAVELYGEYGDPNDVLSTSQTNALQRAAVLLDQLSMTS